MNERFQRITHKDKRITYIDYSSLASDNEALFINTIKEATLYVKKFGANQLVLINVQDTYTNKAIVAQFKDTAKELKPNTRRMAVLGITGAKVILLKAVNLFAKMDITSKSNYKDAVNWLIK